MFGPTSITIKGQVTVPEEVRRALGISKEDKMFFENIKPEQGKVTLRVIKTKGVAERLYGSLKSDIKMSNIEDARNKVAKDLADYYKL